MRPIAQIHQQRIFCSPQIRRNGIGDPTIDPAKAVRICGAPGYYTHRFVGRRVSGRPGASRHGGVLLPARPIGDVDQLASNIDQIDEGGHDCGQAEHRQNPAGECIEEPLGNQ